MPERPIDHTTDDREDELRRLAEEEKKKEAEKVAEAAKPKESFFTRLAHRIRDGFRKIADAIKTMAGVEHNKIVLGRENYNKLVKKEYEAAHKEGRADILNVTEKEDRAANREDEPEFDNDWLNHIDESDIPPGYVTESLSVEDAYEAFMSVDGENVDFQPEEEVAPIEEPAETPVEAVIEPTEIEEPDIASVVEETELEASIPEPAAPKAEKAVCLDAESYKRAVDSGKYTEVSLLGGKSVVEVTAYKDGVGWAFRDGAGNPISGGKVDKIVKNHSAIKDIDRASTSIGKDIIGEAKDKLDRGEAAFEPRLYIYQDRAVLVEADKGVIDITPQTAEHETPQEFRIKDSANKVGMAISNAFTAPDRESLDAPDSIEGEPDVSNIIDYHDFSFIDDTEPGDIEVNRDEHER